MKKVILALAIVSVSFAACNSGDSKETPAADTAAVKPADTTVVKVDTGAAKPADTTVVKVDTAAAKH